MESQTLEAQLREALATMEALECELQSRKTGIECLVEMVGSLRSELSSSQRESQLLATENALLRSRLFDAQTSLAEIKRAGLVVAAGAGDASGDSAVDMSELDLSVGTERPSGLPTTGDAQTSSLYAEAQEDSGRLEARHPAVGSGVDPPFTCIIEGCGKSFSAKRQLEHHYHFDAHHHANLADLNSSLLNG
ncbi:hypothetical protein BC830DRAFT_373476 [Chytriomyces sp. MP71]|nr:hypothetical protein BC830DRAFT_373476 [Chytriomyces sp. MP71]